MSPTATDALNIILPEEPDWITREAVPCRAPLPVSLHVVLVWPAPHEFPVYMNIKPLTQSAQVQYFC
jgi:hypothetical protein